MEKNYFRVAIAKYDAIIFLCIESHKVSAYFDSFKTFLYIFWYYKYDSLVSIFTMCISCMSIKDIATVE